MIEVLKHWARSLKRQVMVLWFAARHPDMPTIARLVALSVVGYALSPIDLIPDFIPVFGLLDDLVLLPLGIALVIRLTPRSVIEASRAQALDWERQARRRPTARWMGAVIVLVWLAAVCAVGAWCYSLWLA